MSLLDRIEILNCETLHPVRGEVSIAKSDEPIQRAGFSYTYLYKAALRCFVAFEANAAEYDIAKKNAADCLLNFVYGDAMKHVHALRYAIHHNDRERAMKICNELEREFRGL
jgi:hypothetical protein